MAASRHAVVAVLCKVHILHSVLHRLFMCDMMSFHVAYNILGSLEDDTNFNRS